MDQQPSDDAATTTPEIDAKLSVTSYVTHTWLPKVEVIKWTTMSDHEVKPSLSKSGTVAAAVSTNGYKFKEPFADIDRL